MQIISHRRNTLEDLKSTSKEYGIEVDIRSYGKKLIVHHEPYIQGVYFEEWLKFFQHQTLILNVKEEGLEERILEYMQYYEINDFFFLDQSFPFLMKTAKSGERRCAVRVSEYESIETAFAIAALIDWVWVDCFSKFPLTGSEARKLQNMGLNLCLVSPELEGFDAKRYIPMLRETLIKEAILCEAVCTKFPELWS